MMLILVAERCDLYMFRLLSHINIIQHHQCIYRNAFQNVPSNLHLGLGLAIVMNSYNVHVDAVVKWWTHVISTVHMNSNIFICFIWSLPSASSVSLQPDLKSPYQRFITFSIKRSHRRTFQHIVSLKLDFLLRFAYPISQRLEICE